MDRRAFVRYGLAGLPVGMLGTQQDSVARLFRPDLAGRPRDRITDYENDPFVVGLERRIRCTCGCNLDVYTCRTTDFTCTRSPELHREVVALVEQDMTGEEILDAFLTRHGEAILMAPPKEGFNWAGYLLPGVVITLVGSVLGLALVRRSRAAAVVVTANSDATAFPGLSPEDTARLQSELDYLDD